MCDAKRNGSANKGTAISAMNLSRKDRVEIKMKNKAQKTPTAM